MSDMSGQLLVSVSGVTSANVDHARAFAAEMDARGVPVSWLIAPRRKHKYRLTDDVTAMAWFRERRDLADGLVLNGYDAAATKRRRAEFATLGAHEANLRLRAADRALEDAGLRATVFAGPRWAVSAGTLTVLPRNGFDTAATLTEIRDLVNDEVIRARVIGIGEGFLSEPWWCRMVVQATGRVVRRGGIARLAITGKHLMSEPTRRAMIDAVDLALLHGAQSSVYGHPRKVGFRAA